MTSSFTTKRLTRTTFVIQEHDAYKEHPLIYAKTHPKAPVIVLSDTGCDAPSKNHKHDEFVNLRQYLEQCPLPCNDNSPLNPRGKRRYIIICTHCHYDHIGGIMHFLEGGNTEIVASSAGRDFVESDLATHGLFSTIGRPTPVYKVTKWAQAFERLTWPFPHPDRTIADTQTKDKTDLGITIIQTIGHTPDELAWYDHDEMHLYVGDSFYREGKDEMPIVFPQQGSMIEWIFAMQKLAVFVRTENAKAAAAAETASAGDPDWVNVTRRVLVSCAHQTTNVDGADILAELEQFSYRVITKDVPLVEKRKAYGSDYGLWRETAKKRTPMSILAPTKLMDEVRDFFGHPR